MTSSRDLRRQFADLPHPIQERLVEIGRDALGMSMEEKATARLSIGTITLVYAGSQPLDHPAETWMQMLASLGVVIAEADKLAGDEASPLVGGA